MLQLLELQGRTERHSKFTIGPREFLDLKENTEQTAVNCTVDMSGENCNYNVIMCAEISERQRNDFCFKTSYRNCECKYVNGTSSEARLP
jgi:hypothetical protein